MNRHLMIAWRVDEEQGVAVGHGSIFRGYIPLAPGSITGPRRVSRARALPIVAPLFTIWRGKTFGLDSSWEIRQPAERFKSAVPLEPRTKPVSHHHHQTKSRQKSSILGYAGWSFRCHKSTGCS